MEDKLKEFQDRKNKIHAQLDRVGQKIGKINILVTDLSGSTAILPFSLPFDNASLSIKKDMEHSTRTKYIYYRSDFVEERRLIEATAEIRMLTMPYLDQFVEYVFSEVEKNLGIGSQVASIDAPLNICCPGGECQQCQEEAEERYQDAYEEWKENGFTDK